MLHQHLKGEWQGVNPPRSLYVKLAMCREVLKTRRADALPLARGDLTAAIWNCYAPVESPCTPARISIING